MVKVDSRIASLKPVVVGAWCYSQGLRPHNTFNPHWLHLFRPVAFLWLCLFLLIGWIRIIDTRSRSHLDEWCKTLVSFPSEYCCDWWGRGLLVCFRTFPLNSSDSQHISLSRFEIGWDIQDNATEEARELKLSGISRIMLQRTQGNWN